MNLDESLTLEAGSELDALVAERVMGWKPPGHRETLEARHRRKLSHSAYDWHWYSPEGEFARPPKFSTDISAAWQVVEKMREHDWPVCRIQVEESHVFCGFYMPSYQQEASEKTLPLAICRAALLAIKSQNPSSV